MPTFAHDGMQFHYRTAGDGLPFFFQHGLTGNIDQPFGLLVPPSGVQLLAFDCRAHGLTEPVAPSDKIGLATFADDLAAFMDHRGIPKGVIGGISMGSAISLNFALRYPDRVLGLVVSRPAWLEGPLPDNVELYSYLTDLVRRHGAAGAKETFLRSPRYAQILAASPDVAGSLIRHFDIPRLEERLPILERIPRDRPYDSLKQLGAIQVPTLVLANRQDPVHPFAFGEAIAAAIPGAEFQELTPKSVDRDRHTADVQRFVEAFLRRHFLSNTGGSDA